MIKLFDIKMNDGSRHFGDMPETVSFHNIREHASKLRGAVETAFVTDEVTEMWLDLIYNGHQFSINNQCGEYWFFVNDHKCPDEILFKVLEHFRALLKTKQ